MQPAPASHPLAFITEQEFRWVIGWIIAGAATVLSVVAGVVGYVFKRLTMLPCRSEMQTIIDRAISDARLTHDLIVHELTERQVMLHTENSHRFDRIEAKVDRIVERHDRERH